MNLRSPSHGPDLAIHLQSPPSSWMDNFLCEYASALFIQRLFTCCTVGLHHMLERTSPERSPTGPSVSYIVQCHAISDYSLKGRAAQFSSSGPSGTRVITFGGPNTITRAPRNIPSISHQSDVSGLDRAVLEAGCTKPVRFSTCIDAYFFTAPRLQNNCAVCTDQFKLVTGDPEKQVVVTLPCKHFFHGCCILPWLKLSGTCPVCR